MPKGIAILNIHEDFDMDVRIRENQYRFYHGNRALGFCSYCAGSDHKKCSGFHLRNINTKCKCTKCMKGVLKKNVKRTKHLPNNR